jgi:hypothetical protein
MGDYDCDGVVSCHCQLMVKGERSKRTKDGKNAKDKMMFEFINT